jgi:hypothetical protein
MDENNLQLNALKFVEKIITVENESNKQSYESWQGSSSHLGITDLSDNYVEAPVIVTQYMSDLSDYEIYIMISNIKYGFTESDYKLFYKLVYEISEWKNIQSNVSIDYLKEKTLRWIVDIYINNVYTIDLFSFLENNLSKDVNKYKYCFPILNIDIEKDFSIGESKIKYFSKEYFDEFYKTRLSKDECSEENFNKIYRKYQGQVFVEIEVFAESKKAELIAYENSCFIIDILKLCGPTIQFPTEICYLELESRMPFSYDFLRFKNDDIYDFSITTKVNRSQMLPFDLKLVNDYKPFFDEFGKLLNPKYNSEIEKLVKNSIIFYSKCISETDIHLRVSQFIMIIESIFLLDDEKYKMENKCKRRFLDFSFDSRMGEKINFNEILTEMYQIRHKMTHKSIRIFIDYAKLRIFQIEIINLLFLILRNSHNFENKELLINHLDKKATA